MKPYLLDVNVLVALVDPLHGHHRRAMTWFTSAGRTNWMTCPTTQNGVIRIVSNPKYSPSTVAPARIIEVLRRLTAVGNHTFIPDSVSLLDGTHVDPEQLRQSKQVTDTYLLALSAAANATLATFDQRISTDAVARGQLFLIP